MRIAVAGGTGLVGRYVVAELRAAGHDPVVLTRSAGADVITGDGLDAALDGAASLIDVTNTATMTGRKSVAFFTAGTGNLLAAGRRSGVQHHVALSIVGTGRPGMGSGYNAGKVAQEALVRRSGMPFSIMRATQFHQFIPELLDRIPGPVLVVPRMRIQPVAACEVAAALAALAAGPPAGMAPEMAGPSRPSWPTWPGSSAGSGAAAARCCRCECRARPAGPWLMGRCCPPVPGCAARRRSPTGWPAHRGRRSRPSTRHGRVRRSSSTTALTARATPNASTKPSHGRSSNALPPSRPRKNA